MKTTYTLPENLIDQFSNFITSTMGLYFSQDRKQFLEKTFFLAMHHFKFTNPENFIEWLFQNSLSKELIAFLSRYLTIGETYFFRDNKIFATLEHQILPNILDRHKMDRKIRIWCAGCCTGEEPYSIAIILHRLLKNFKNWDIFILGTDINEEFLRKAKQARYKPWSFRATSPQTIKKYFVNNSDSTFSPIQEIKEKVTFNYLNLVDKVYPHPFTKTQEMDLILCQNVLIYFSKQQIEKIVHQLTNALQNQGWLGVSAVEIPFVNDEHVVLHRFQEAVFFKKEHKNLQSSAPLVKTKGTNKIQREKSLKKLTLFVQSSKNKRHLSSAEKVCSTKHLATNNQADFYETCLCLSHQKKYDEAIAKLLAYFSPYQKNADFLRQRLKELILLIHLYANQGNLLQAIEWCEKALKLHTLNPELYYLQAMVLHSLGEIQKARQSLVRTIFLDPNFVIAHYLLGLIEQQSEKPAKAFRCFKTALELVEKYQTDDIVPGTDELTAGGLKDILLNLLEKS